MLPLRLRNSSGFGKLHLTEAEQASHTVVQWHTFDELVRLINEQEFDRVQGKNLKARDVAALREYAAWNMDKESMRTP